VANPAKKQVARDVKFLVVFTAKNMTSLVADGLLGLAPKAPPSYPAKTLLEEMYD